MRGVGRRRRSPLPRRRRRWVGGSWCAADRSPYRQYRLPGHATPPHHPDSRPGHAGGVCGIASTGSGSRHRHGGPGPGRGPRGLGQVVRLLPRSRRCGRQWSVDACHRGALPRPRRPGRRDRRRSWGYASVRWPLLGLRDPCRRPIHPRGALNTSPGPSPVDRERARGRGPRVHSRKPVAGGPVRQEVGPVRRELRREWATFDGNFDGK